jgi:hypothetical protein
MARPGYVGGNCGPDLLVTFDSDTLCDAVVKVPPPVGSVKYKAQHIVLPMQILPFLACYKPPPTKLTLNPCGFPPKAAANAGFAFAATAIPGTGPRKPHAERPTSALPHPLRLGFPPPHRKAQNQCIQCGQKVGKWKKGNHPQLPIQPGAMTPPNPGAMSRLTAS